MMDFLEEIWQEIVDNFSDAEFRKDVVLLLSTLIVPSLIILDHITRKP